MLGFKKELPPQLTQQEKNFASLSEDGPIIMGILVVIFIFGVVIDGEWKPLAYGSVAFALGWAVPRAGDEREQQVRGRREHGRRARPALHVLLIVRVIARRLACNAKCTISTL